MIVFKKLGEIITRRPLAIIAVWVLVVILMAPFAGNLSSRLSYDGSKFMPQGTDSSMAQAIFDKQLPSDSKTQMVVVVRSDDPNASAAFIKQLNRTLQNDTALKNLTSADSIDSVQRMMLSNMTPELHQSLVEGQDNLSDANHKMYQGMDDVRNGSNGLYWLWDNVTTTNDQFYKAKKQIVSASSGLYSARDRVQGMVDAIYGVPAYYAGVYAQVNGTGQDDTNSSNAANQQTQAFINGEKISDDNKKLALYYLGAFDGAWRAPSSYDPNPMTRAQKAINTAAPAFVNGMITSGSVSSDQGKMMLGIVSSVTLNGYISDRAGTIDNLVIGMAASQGGVSRGSIEEIYYLGRNPSDAAIGNYLTGKAIDTLKNSDTGKNMSAPDLQNATRMIHDAWSLGGAATKQDFDNYVLQFAGKGLNASQNQGLLDVWNLGPNPNQTVIEDYVLAQAAKNGSMNQSQINDARDIIALGRNASNATIQSYLVNKTMDTLGITGNGSYFLAVMSLDRNMSNASLEVFGAQWADTHDYTNPEIVPSQLAGNLVSGNVSLYVVQLNVDSTKDTVLAASDLAELRGKITEVKKDGGFANVNAYVTGSYPITADTKAAAFADVSTIDIFTIGIVLIILLIYFRSFLTPFIPLLSIVIAIIASMGAVTLVSYTMSLYYVLEEFMVVIMMGAGIDYCVFMLSRYKEERHEGRDVKSAVVTTVENAGKSIASSGLTAALGFAALTLTGQGMLMSMGIGVAIGLVISMLSALTLIPAILTIVGDRIFWPNKVHNVKSGATLTGLWLKLTGGVIKHAKIITVLTILLAVPTVYFAAQITTGSDTISMLPHNIESKQGFDVLEKSMGSGAMTRTMITVTLPVNLTDASGNRSVDAMDRIENISAMVAGVKDVNTAYSMTRPDGTTINYGNLSEYNAIEKGYYENYMDHATGLDDRTTVIYATFNGSPYSNEAFAAIDTMHAMLQNNSSGALQGTEVHIGGGTAQTHELAATTDKGFLVVLPVVIGGIVLILLVLLRSAVMPVRIMLTLSMSILMTLAAYVIVYQIGQNEPMLFILPIIFFCALMGVGVDYDIFLVTRVEEEMQKGMGLKEAITKAVSSTGTIILVCALVMAGAFGSLILASMQIMSQMGFVLSLGILIQAVLMMLIVVPAIKSLLGKWNWWIPGRKEKVETVTAASPQQEENIEK